MTARRPELNLNAVNTGGDVHRIEELNMEGTLYSPIRFGALNRPNLTTQVVVLHVVFETPLRKHARKSAGSLQHSCDNNAKDRPNNPDDSAANVCWDVGKESH
jgi:hypothetical protein